jgi:AcrR family transcriptional regulator
MGSTCQVRLVTKSEAPAALEAPDDARRRRLLDAALSTFIRYGFRKTSMEEVARASHLSRQGLYLHFATKEELFHAAVRHALETGLEAAVAQLKDESLPLRERLTRAFDEWTGRYVGSMSANMADLEEASDQLVGRMIPEHDELFVDKVTRVIKSSALPSAYKPSGLTARQLAETLHATARGLKHHCASRADFRKRIEIAVRALCTPLQEAGGGGNPREAER